MPAGNLDFPSNSPISDAKGTVAQDWLQWFQRVQNVVWAVNSSGVTADRPTKYVWVGRFYYDTTLGKPIWVNSVKPIVWHDATGAVV